MSSQNNVSNFSSPYKTRSGQCHSPRDISLSIIFFGSASGVARGRCGVDLMCLPLGAITETVESPGASCNLQGIDF
jgi:hypothetical protein